MKRMVRFLRSQKGWNTVLTVVFTAAVAGGYTWARSGEDSWERLFRTWIVMWGSVAVFFAVIALFLSPPWFRKSNKGPVRRAVSASSPVVGCAGD